MTAFECCNTDVVSASPDAKVMEVVRMMDEKNVGCVIIVEKQMPVGIITDRDVVLRVMGKEKDPKKIAVRDVMTKDPVVVEGGKGLFEAMRKFEGKNFRRMPVVDERGRVTGILTTDDMIRLLSKELSFITTVIQAQTPNI
ncbi:MAG: CBS domain-containing protein [Methanomicrobiales archaeon]|nr:CBS domain-containing protein [Methanomicrobiales archaeon]